MRNVNKIPGCTARSPCVSRNGDSATALSGYMNFHYRTPLRDAITYCSGSAQLRSKSLLINEYFDLLLLLFFLPVFLNHFTHFFFMIFKHQNSRGKSDIFLAAHKVETIRKVVRAILCNFTKLYAYAYTLCSLYSDSR